MAIKKDFIKNHPGLFLTGIIILWYILSTAIDLVCLSDTNFSKLFFLNEAYLGMKPVGIPLPEAGILLFLLGSFLIIAIYLLTDKRIPQKQTLKYVLSILDFSFLIFVLLYPYWY